ncbi:MAG: arylesterase [Verrucomicrobiales bacterium]|nr:arylesterase [Verrucomicrobiales bacterium]
MKPSTIGLIFAALLFSGCGKRATIEALNDSSVVLAFGDSLTFGYGASEDSSYPVVLAKLIGVQVVNAGVPGEDSSAALRRLPASLEAHQADLVILCTGGNDMLQKQSQAKLKSNLTAMVDLIQQAGADVMIVAVPAPGIMLKVPNLYAEVAQEQHLPYEGDVIKEVLSDASLKSDLVHPNEEGYRRMAEAFAALIKRSELK